MKVTFIIPSYNTVALTTQCIESLKSTVELENHEVIIIDDASTDGSREYLQSLPSTYKVILNSFNQGFGRNCNQAAQAATGDFLCFCNSDLVFLRGWLKPLLDTFEKYNSIGFAGNMQRRVDNKWIDHLGVYFLPNGLPLHIGQNCSWPPILDYLPVSAVTAACCMVRTQLFREFGGFDEKYLNGFEDTDLCLRMNQVGYQHYVAARSVVLHHVSSSPGRKNKEDLNLTLFLKNWQSVTQEIAAKDAKLWRNFHRAMQYPRFLRWPLLLQKRICLY